MSKNKPPWSHHIRFTNSLILFTMVVLTLTGVYGLFWTLNGWVFDIHRYAGWLLIVSIPWKAVISARSLRRGIRPGFDRGVMIFLSLLLAVVSIGVILLGLLWSWRLGPEQYWLRQTAISWHWMLALGLLVPFLVHVWRRWPRPRQADLLSRRAVLKSAGLGAAALAGWRLAEASAVLRADPEAPRRKSGSRQAEIFSGNRFPVTHNLPASVDQVDLVAWRLVLRSKNSEPRSFTYNELVALPARPLIATLDCTLGWYTTQTWSGIPLTGLLDHAGISLGQMGVWLVSVTGYREYLPAAEAEKVLLATHVGGEILAHDHGFPLRAVVPTRRGWFWVKWLAEVENL